jgi:alpha-tubulin suppressor-like RCC1 family protein
MLALLAALSVFAAGAASAGATEHGAAVAWGENYHGGLGQFYRNTQEEQALTAGALSNIVSTSAAGSVTLVQLSSGELDSWGQNAHGQLGNNGFKANWERGESHETVSELSEGTTVPLKNVTGFAAADEHGIARIGSGLSSSVVTWGNNQYATLGNGKGTFENARTPRTVSGISNVKSVAAGGGSAYVVLETGKVEAWGENTGGQLAAEGWPAWCKKNSECVEHERAAHKAEDEEEPAGKEHAYEEKSEYLCNTETGPEICDKKPHYVVNEAGAPIEHVVQVVAGATSAYALLESGEVLSWGENRLGQLGRWKLKVGDHTGFDPAAKVTLSGGEALQGVVELAAGYDHVLARLENGHVVGWGDNTRAELGAVSGEAEICLKSSELKCIETPKAVAGLQPEEVSPGSVEALAAGTKFTLALISHKVYAFGRNGEGELGDGEFLGPELCTTEHENEKYSKKAEKDEKSAKTKEEAHPAEKEAIEKQLANQLASLKKQEEIADACDKTPATVKAYGGGIVEHARAISATSSHSIALLQEGVEPHAPPVSVTSETLPGEPPLPALNFKWQPKYIHRINFRVFERPGENEAEGEAGGGEECLEEETETCEAEGGLGGSGAPVNTTLPLIKHLPGSLAEGESMSEIIVGQSLITSEGLWTGKEKITFSIQWERCAGTCTAISGATKQEYSPVSADLEHTLRVTVTATNSVAPEGVKATSAQTEVVKSTPGKSNSDSITLSEAQEAEPGFLLDEFKEKPTEAGTPLSEVPYEVKLTTSTATGAKNLTTALTP